MTPSYKKTMLDSETEWFEIVQYNDKHESTISILVEQAWLCRYPRPKIIMCNSRNELLSHMFNCF